jgi:hypothetical protein
MSLYRTSTLCQLVQAGSGLEWGLAWVDLGLVLEVGLASASEPALHPESAMALGLALVV